jgi:hypothetical protein
MQVCDHLHSLAGCIPWPATSAIADELFRETDDKLALIAAKSASTRTPDWGGIVSPCVVFDPRKPAGACPLTSRPHQPKLNNQLVSRSSVLGSSEISGNTTETGSAGLSLAFSASSFNIADFSAQTEPWLHLATMAIFR